MRIIPIAFDSFSTRSMATLIETDLRILIDPSVSIAPYRYGLPPTQEELEELNRKINEIIDLSNKVDIFIITHYHWDHCPHPNSEHIKALIGKQVLAKDFRNTNKSQYLRGRQVLSVLKDMEFVDGKTYEIGNTYIEFSRGVWHGENRSKLGKVIMVYIEYKGRSMIFASDIQGILTKDAKDFIIRKNPKILIMSGPPIYHYKWKKELEELNLRNISEVLDKTDIEKIIIDHHLARSKDYQTFLLNYNTRFKNIFLSAAEFLGKKNRLLEANRDILYKLSFK